MKIKNIFTAMALMTMSLTATAQQLGSGIDLGNCDTSVRAADDFYQYACGGWMQKNPLPAAYSRYGSFDVLGEENNKRINGILTEQIFKKPIFVTDYPREIKAFYMRLNDDGKTVAAADCLVPGVGEIIGGSQREERLDVLTARMKELGLKEEDYWWYLDLRRYGSVRHAGYGLGFERMVMYLTGVSNIRDVELHPRTTGNADF